MLTYKLTNCPECNSIASLLNEIDCKLVDNAKKQYNNTVYMLNSCLSQDSMFDLLMYKRILQYKSCNSTYASQISIDKIAARVKVLIFK